MTTRGECPVCGQQIALTQGGRLRGHGGSVPCQGRARFPAKEKPPRTPEQERIIERGRLIVAVRNRAEGMWVDRRHGPTLLDHIKNLRAALDGLEALIRDKENPT